MEYRDILKTARANRGYTQEHLAKLSGLSQAMISRLENGFIPDDDARKKIGAILPETLGEEAPNGISQMLTMKLNSEAKNVSDSVGDKEETETVDAWKDKDKAEDAETVPQKPDMSDLTRIIVERDIYKRLYDELLAKVISR